MSTTVRIQIDQPCHENWQAMTPSEMGRFCKACQKQVVDFSTMTDKEILDYISTATSSICANATRDQLNRDIKVPGTKKRYTLAYVWNLLLAAFLITRADAQVTPVKKPVTTTQAPDDIFVGTIGVRTHAVRTEINGTVIDSTNGAPLPGVSVMIKGTNRGVATDSLGKFKLLLDDDEPVELELSSVGFTRKTILAGSSEPLTVALSRIGSTLEAVVIESVLHSIRGRVGGVVIVKKESIPQKIKRMVLPNKEIKATPNPVIRGNNIQVNLFLPQPGAYKLELMDAAGKVVLVQAVQMPDKTKTIQVPTNAHWSAGMYWFRLTGQHINKVFHTKLLLQ